MLRINQIIKILSDMKPYAPYTYKSKTDKLIDKIHGKLLAIVIVIISALVLCIVLYESTSFTKTDVIVDVILWVIFHHNVYWASNNDITTYLRSKAFNRLEKRII